MTQPIHDSSLKEAVSSLRVQHRDRIHALARWSLAEGRPVPMEHAALIIGAALRLTEPDGCDPQLLLSVMGCWCAEQRVAVPAGIDASVATYVRFLRSR
jgi:hypothetical protein